MHGGGVGKKNSPGAICQSRKRSVAAPLCRGAHGDPAVGYGGNDAATGFARQISGLGKAPTNNHGIGCDHCCGHKYNQIIHNFAAGEIRAASALVTHRNLRFTGRKLCAISPVVIDRRYRSRVPNGDLSSKNVPFKARQETHRI